MTLEKRRIANYNAAIFEAERFIKRAKLALKELKLQGDYHYGCKETGSAKRSSMDLTRALSELRK